MKKKFFETNSFRKEQKDWYKKLKETGFQDTESQANIDHDSVTKQQFKVDHKLVEYGQKCELYLNSGQITDPLDLYIFDLHCQGISNNEISRRLAGSSHGPLHRSNVDRRIKRILEAAGITPVDFGSV